MLCLTRRMRSTYSFRLFRSRLLCGLALQALVTLMVELCSVRALRALCSTRQLPLLTPLATALAASSAWVGKSLILRLKCTRVAHYLSTNVHRLHQLPVSCSTTSRSYRYRILALVLVGGLTTVVGVLVGFRVFRSLTRLRPPLPSLQASSGTPSMGPTVCRG